MDENKDTPVTITLNRKQIPAFNDAVFYARKKLTKIMANGKELEDRTDAAQSMVVLDAIAKQVKAQVQS